jgi:hypothetical protein
MCPLSRKAWWFGLGFSAGIGVATVVVLGTIVAMIHLL